MFRPLRFKVIFICFMVLFASSAFSFTLVEDGRPASSIALLGEPSPPEKLAARELQDYIRRISGAELEITEGMAAVPGAQIVIGTLENSAGVAPAAVLKTLEAAESDRSFYLKSSGGNLYITGRKPAGALYGAYTLLEKMGVRWFYPGELGEHVPKKSSIVLERTDNFQSPSLNIALDLVLASVLFKDSMEWQARNKMIVYARHGSYILEDGDTERGNNFLSARAATNRGGCHHGIRRAVPADKYFESNPEYFALLDGKRTVTATGREQRCLSNPVVKKLFAKSVLEHTLTENSVYLLGTEDSVRTWCQCEECRKMGTADGEYRVTNYVHRFFSDISARVREENPEARIHFYIYSDFRGFPDADGIPYDTKDVGVYCTHQRCNLHAFNDPSCAMNRRQNEEWLQWREIVPKMMMRDYLSITNSEYAPLEYILAEDLKYLNEIGAYGWYDEVSPVNAVTIPSILAYIAERRPDGVDQWLPRWQTYYLAAQLGWNTALDSEDFMEETYDIYYGEAAPAMKKYHALRRRLWENAPAGHVYYDGPRRIGYCLTVPGAEEEIFNYLDEAEKLGANDEMVLRRIAMDRDYLNRFWKAAAEERRQMFSAERQLVPLRVAEKITIDGELAEEAWLSARPLDDFISLRSQSLPIERTSVRVLYDNENLYFGVVAMAENTWGDPYELKSEATGSDPRVWEDDSVEILIAPPVLDGEGIYYHIMSNTEGVIYDARCEGAFRDTSYDSKVEVAVRKLPDRQIYEFKVPLEPMGAFIPGQTWGMHFVRNCHSLQVPVTTEHSTVDGILPTDTERFRRAVLFGESGISNSSFAELIPAGTGSLSTYHKGVIGGNWVDRWGLAGRGEAEVIEGEASNMVRVKGATLFQSLRRIPEAYRATGSELKMEINAYGEGLIGVRMSTQPGWEWTTLERYELGETPATFRYTFNLGPDLGAVFYIDVTGEAFINNASVAITGLSR